MANQRCFLKFIPALNQKVQVDFFRQLQLLDIILLLARKLFYLISVFHNIGFFLNEINNFMKTTVILGYAKLV